MGGIGGEVASSSGGGRRNVGVASLVLLTALALSAAAGAAPLFDEGRTARAKAKPKRPDLVVRTLAVPAGATLTPTESLAVSATTRNRGRATARASVTRLYLSADKKNGTGDLLVATWRAKALRAGRSWIGRPKLTLPAGAAAGTYFLVACADDLRKVRESNERNNCRAAARKVGVTLGPNSPPPPPPPPAPDTTPPPVPLIAAGPPDLTNSSAATFTFTNPEAGATFLCRLDTEVFAACESPKAYTGLPDGEHTFAVKARDAAGNESVPATRTWRLDTTPPPAPGIGSGPPPLTNSAAASFAFTSTEAGVSFLCRVDDQPFAACESPKAYSALADGEHTFAVRARDAAGNESVPATRTWRVDTTPPPAPGIGSAPPPLTNSAAASFAFTSTEAAASFLCRLDSEPFAACESPKAYSALADGEHTFAVRARDAAGNEGTPNARTWRVDTAPPAAPAIGSGPPPLTNSAAASFTFTSAESGVSFLCGVDGEAFAACESPKAYSSLADGEHAFAVEARDAAGNESAATTRTWRVDTTPPPATSAACQGSPCDDRWYSLQAEVALTATDAESGVAAIRYTTNGDTPTASSGTVYSAPFTLTQTTTLKSRAVDNAGNVGLVSTVGVKVDATAPTAPTLTFASLSAASATGPTVYFRPSASAGGFTVTAASTDGDSGVEAYEFPAAAPGWTRTLSGASARFEHTGAGTAPAGGHEVRARDRAQLRSTPSAFSLAADGTAPETNATCNGDECFMEEYGAAVTVELASSDVGSGVAAVRYTLDGSNPGPAAGVLYDGPFDVDETTTVKYRAYDAVGNEEAVGQIALTLAELDRTPPAAPGLVVGANTRTVADGSTVYFRPGTTGSFWVRAEATDPDSGVDAFDFPDLGAGWTKQVDFLPSFCEVDPCDEPTRAVATYTFSATAVEPGRDRPVTATNDDGFESASSLFHVIADAAPPTTLGECDEAPCAPGTYFVGITVALSAQDGGAGVKEIRYTLDGTEPGPSTGTVYSRPFRLAETTTVRYRAFDLLGNAEAVASRAIVVSDDEPAPADPRVTATPIDGTVASSVVDDARFLYRAAQRVQFGLASSAIDARRAAVVRGKVTAATGAPVVDVRVSVLDHPEYGRTRTRADGHFDLVLEGGGFLTLEYEKAGFLPVQRRVEVPWRDYAWADDVVMTPYDTAVTGIDLDSAASVQVARANPVTDGLGTRRATLLFSAGTGATLELPDGSTQPLSDLSVRATEYTVGDAGPDAMPGELPEASGYTYAVELSVDEAIAAGASHVRFSKPVVNYLENYRQFPVGVVVPTGSYDREQARWVGEPNGRVVKVIAETPHADGPLAEVDTDGDGVADNGLGINEAERRSLATLYDAGQTLWRVPVTHFSAWDHNWPYVLPPDAEAPDPPEPREEEEEREVEEPKCKKGSSIACENQVLGESLDVLGTPAQLRYSSDRLPGRREAYEVTIPLTGASPPVSLKRIHLQVLVAGQRHDYSFARSANLTKTFVWDGLDAYGRELQGRQPVRLRIGYTYEGVYKGTRLPIVCSICFAQVSPLTGLALDTVEGPDRTLWQEREVHAGVWDTRRLGNGGWTYSRQHVYNPEERLLMRGDGTDWASQDVKRVIRPFAGDGAVRFNSGEGGWREGLPAREVPLEAYAQIDVGPDGSVYGSELIDSVFRIAPDGTFETIAGGRFRMTPGEPSPPAGHGDGGPAKLAYIDEPRDVAVGPDGSVYVAERRIIRRIFPDGTITTIAGDGTISGLPSWSTYGGDDKPALQSNFYFPEGIDVAPDGTVYVADHCNHRVRKITPDGMITTLAGTGNPNCVGGGFSGDGGPATQARLARPHDVAVGPDGGVYIADEENQRIRRVGPDGIITTYAGNGIRGGAGDGGPATAARLDYPTQIEFDAEGALWIAEALGNRVRKVDPDGTITTVAGTGVFGRTGDGGPAAAARVEARGIAITPEGSALVIGGGYIREIGPVLPGFSNQEIVLPSPDGEELYVHDRRGRHLRTLDGRTKALRERFLYDAAGYLTGVEDADGNSTALERSGDGVLEAIVADGGQRTEVDVTDAHLTEHRNPAGEETTFAYTARGLLTGLTDPAGRPHSFAYDAATGRLTRDEGPDGKVTQLAYSATADGFQVTAASGLGQTWTYKVDRLPNGDVRRTQVSPSGASTITLVEPSGKTTRTTPDGIVATATSGPDPRYGMQVPIEQSFSFTVPDGRKTTRLLSREVELSDPFDLTSLVRQTDTITVNGREYTREYDASTRTYTMTTPEGHVSTTTLDPRGRVVSRTGDGVAPVEFSYDTAGRIAGWEQGARSLTYAYDAKNRVTSTENAAGEETSYVYDLADRPTRVTLPSGRQYEFTYDANGNRTSATMPSTGVHALAHTPGDRLESYAPPGNAPYSFEYDADRRRKKTTLPGGRTITPTYAGDRAVSQADADATTSLAYVGSTKLLDIVARTPSAGGAPQVLDFDYLGSLPTKATFTGPASGTFSYRYGSDLRLAGVTHGTGPEWSITRDQDGRTTGFGPLTFEREGPNGGASRIGDGTLAVELGYDDHGRVAGRTHTVGATAAYDLDITYDTAGRIAQRTETVAGSTHVFAYDYDADGRLTSVARDGTGLETYAYDANGNRTSRTRVGAPAEAASYDAQDRLVTRGLHAHLYDAAGFLTGRGADLFQYSARGELLRAVLGGGGAVTYRYDGLGRRVARTEASGTTQYLYGNPQQLFQLTASRAPDGTLTTYIYDDGGRLLLLERAGARFYVATDQVGSPRVVTDSAGTHVKVVEYDSFGVEQSDSAPGFDLALGFAGGIADETTGLVRLGLRDYDPAAGRWTSRDSLLFDGGQANLYVYAGNDPVGLADPFGFFSVEASAYWLFGGGFKFSITGEGISFCLEAGVGAGVGVSVDPFGDLDPEGVKVMAEAGGAIGPLSASAKVEVSDDCLKLEAKACIWPACIKAGVGDPYRLEDLENAEVGMEVTPTDIPLEVGLQGKLAAQGCLAGSW